MNAAPVIVWFRKDLRLGDNPALHAAAQLGQPIVPVFILDEQTSRPLGTASKWWLHRSLEALSERIPLVFRRGAALAQLQELIAETGATGVYWNRLYEAEIIARDSEIKAALTAQGLTVQSFGGRYLAEPWVLKTKAGGLLKVFTPYWKALCAHYEQYPLPTALPLPDPLWASAKSTADKTIQTEALADWSLLLGAPDWSGGLAAQWTPGEDGAWTRYQQFAESALASYIEDRNRPDLPGVSRLSPHLHWGEISVGQLWHATCARGNSPSHEHFLKELTWRDFAAYLLYHFPALTTDNWRKEFDSFPWAEDQQALVRWQRGQTGYPIVDAGMRELWATGWMHNRVRMIVASFLVKHLLQPWQAGERWFWDRLVDADPATNPASWQWVAGCGADAAPYFRIFNPMGQTEKFDPDGTYIKKWLPELARLPNQLIAKPWEASPLILQAAGITLGETYPAPLVRHEEARARALQAFQSLKRTPDEELAQEGASQRSAPA